MVRESSKPKSLDATSSERRNWGNIFDLLVRLVRNQQNQLQSFATQQKFLEERLKMQNDAWASDVRLHNQQISVMKGILMIEEKKRLLEASKADMTLGFKQRESSMFKLILEHTEDELVDFKAWFELLSCKSSNEEDQQTGFKDIDKRKKATVSSDVSALLAEKKFIWNQYNMMENSYADKLRSKQAEVEKASGKIKTLVSSMEQLQSENNEKDSKILQLESKVIGMEAETKRLNEEISGLSAELESLRKITNNQITPVLNHCTRGTKPSGPSGLGINNSSRSRRNINLKKEIFTPKAPAKSSEKGEKSRKRKEGPVIPTSETPKLFSSSFKVPKLKPSLRGSSDT